MTSPQPVAPRRVRQYRGLLGRCAFLVPAVIFGAWRLAGAQEGPHGGDMAPFLVVFAAILVAAKVGGELVERLGQPAVLGELLVGATLAATSVGITARVLRDIGRMDAPESKVILGAAVVSKQACVLGVFKRGLNRWAVGVGMIPRGEVGLIFAGIGHTVLVAGAPVLSDNTFSAIVAMVMLTTLVTPPLLKAAFAEPSAANGNP